MVQEYQHTFGFLSNDQKDSFKRIRNFLAGRFIGATRDRALLDEVVKCLYCRVYIYQNKNNIPETPAELTRLYKTVFSELRRSLPHVFESSKEMLLDSTSIEFVHNELNNINFAIVNRDFFGDLFETFIGSGIREEEGQFFTPKNGMDLLVQMISPKLGEKIIDPACGAGGFLSSAYTYLLESGATSNAIANNIFGIDKDAYLTHLSSTRLSLFTLLESKVYCADSLAWKMENDKELDLDQNEQFDIVLTNPPFGKHIVAVPKTIQHNFELGYKWKFSSKDSKYVKTNTLLANVPPQVLFVEKCISLLKPGGRMGVVLPESLVTSSSYRHVVQFIREKGSILSVVGMPEDFFKTSGKGGTHTKAVLVVFKKHETTKDISKRIFMAEAKWCGHDSRGRLIERDDLPAILENYKFFLKKKIKDYSYLGYEITDSQIVDQSLSPRYYNPDLIFSLDKLKESHDLILFGNLVESGVIEISTGDEVGKLAYGSGDIPFIRTSDISNWEIKADPKHNVSTDIYHSFKNKQDVKAGDILMVKDGTYLIGTCAFITEYDTRILYQSHLYKIRVKKTDVISPYLLLVVLSSELVQKQIKAKRVTQDIIDSLGSRIHELVLPIPKQIKDRQRISTLVAKAIKSRIEARELTRKASEMVVNL
ncbi:MAG: N-6 DNA methylase [Chloroflexota bacterium]